MRPAEEDKQDLDEKRLKALLDLAGPEVSFELADRLIADLTSVAEALSQAEGPDERKSIRAQTHVLAGLAGTIGAAPLSAAAAHLNDLAHRGDAPSLAMALRETLALLRRLLVQLKACLPGMLPEQ